MLSHSEAQRRNTLASSALFQCVCVGVRQCLWQIDLFAALDKPRALRLLNAAHASAGNANEQLAVVVAANDLGRQCERERIGGVEGGKMACW